MKKILLFWVVFTSIIFWEIIFKGFVALPADTLAGANLPWRDYKWGYAVGVPVKNPPISDAFSQFFVWKRTQAELLKSGIFPLWNRYSFSGTPLLATFHTSVLFPSGIFFLLLDQLTAWNLHIILSSFAAGILMAFYLRLHFRNILAIIGGSIVFAFSGPMTTWSEFGTAVWGLSALPLALICVDLLILRPSKQLYFFGLCAATFLVLTAGNVQIATYYFAFMFLYVLFVNRGHQLIRVGIAVALGVGMTAMQLLPTYSFYQHSIRDQEKFSTTFNYGLSSVGEFIRFWAPDFFGSPMTYNHYSNISYHENSNFVGTIGIVLVFVMLLSKTKNRKEKFYSLTFIFVLLLTYSHPVSRFIFSLPLPLFTYSSASRLFFISGTAAAFLVTAALSKLNDESGISLRTILTSVFFMLLTLIFLFYAPPEHRYVSLRNSLLPLMILTLSIGVLLFRFSRKYFLVIAILLLMFDFARYYRKYNPFVSAHLVFPSTPVLDFLQQNSTGYRVINETDEIIPPNTWSYYGLESPEGYDPLYLLSYNRFGQIAGGETKVGPPSRYLDFSRPRSKYLDLLGVKYLVVKTQDDDYVSPAKSEIITSDWKHVFSDGSLEVFENPTPQERVFSPSSLSVFSSLSDMTSHQLDPSFNPVSQVVVLASSGISGFGRSIVNIKAINLLQDGLDFSYSATEPGIAVVSQAYDPGWVAQSRGQKLTLVPAYEGLIAIGLPAADEAVVSLRYFPKEILPAVAISALSLLLLAVIGKMKPWLRR